VGHEHISSSKRRLGHQGRSSRGDIIRLMPVFLIFVYHVQRMSRKPIFWNEFRIRTQTSIKTIYYLINFAVAE